MKKSSGDIFFERYSTAPFELHHANDMSQKIKHSPGFAIEQAASGPSPPLDAKGYLRDF